MKKLCVLLCAIFLLTAVSAFAEVPAISDTLFKTAKDTLSSLSAGDYDTPAANLGFTAEELEKFTTGNFGDLDTVQTQISVGFWYKNSWIVAVPVAEPSSPTVATLVLKSQDGCTFCGYMYAVWSDIETAYESSDYVVWNEEYTTDNLYIIE